MSLRQRSYCWGRFKLVIQTVEFVRFPFLLVTLFSVFLFVAVRPNVTCQAADVRAKLNSNDGSTEFQVRDSADVVVGRVDSDGNLLVVGSATVTGSGLTVSGLTGLGVTNPASRLHVGSSAGTNGPLLLVSTGSVNLLEVNGSSIVVRTGLYMDSSQYNNPDYVFESGHELMELVRLREFLRDQKHLPGVHSTRKVQQNGVEIFEQNRMVLEKLEEAYLYILQLESRVAALERNK